jgi:hypothetical protein
MILREVDIEYDLESIEYWADIQINGVQFERFCRPGDTLEAHSDVERDNRADIDTLCRSTLYHTFPFERVICHLFSQSTVIG